MSESDKLMERISKAGNAVLDFFGSDNFTKGVDVMVRVITGGLVIGIVLFGLIFIGSFIYVKRNPDKFP